MKMKMTDEIKTPMTDEEQEAIHKLIIEEMAGHFCIPCETVTGGGAECATCGTVREV